MGGKTQGKQWIAGNYLAGLENGVAEGQGEGGTAIAKRLHLENL